MIVLCNKIWPNILWEHPKGINLKENLRGEKSVMYRTLNYIAVSLYSHTIIVIDHVRRYKLRLIGN